MLKTGRAIQGMPARFARFAEFSAKISFAYIIEALAADNPWNYPY